MQLIFLQVALTVTNECTVTGVCFQEFIASNFHSWWRRRRRRRERRRRRRRRDWKRVGGLNWRHVTCLQMNSTAKLGQREWVSPPSLLSSSSSWAIFPRLDLSAVSTLTIARRHPMPPLHFWATSPVGRSAQPEPDRAAAASRGGSRSRSSSPPPSLPPSPSLSLSLCLSVSEDKPRQQQKPTLREVTDPDSSLCNKNLGAIWKISATPDLHGKSNGSG